MTKVTLSDLANLQNENTAVGTINANNVALTQAFNNTLSRDGSTPNHMEAAIDMDSNRIFNLPAPGSNNEPLRLQDLIDFEGGGFVVPQPGGTDGQLQYNDSGVFEGISGATSDGTTVTLTSPTLVTAVLGTPASGTLSNCTGFPVAQLSGLGSGIATFLATPSSANLRSALTDETGTGAAVFATSPTITTPTLSSPDLTGTPTAPTAAALTNTTQIATTAFVTAMGLLKIGKVTQQVFTSSGTYTPTTGMLFCIIECVGSGGGGGGVTGNSTLIQNAGGGGSGSYSRLVATAATIGASQTVTVGNAGTGGAAGSNNGAAGSDVSVGTLCIGKGGSGGLHTVSGTLPNGGAGGVAGTGDITVPGEKGGMGLAITSTSAWAYGGKGGDSYFGFGGQISAYALASTTAGQAGTGYGAGGGGGFTQAVAANAAGGDGSKGIVFITEFCVS